MSQLRVVRDWCRQLGQSSASSIFCSPSHNEALGFVFSSHSLIHTRSDEPQTVIDEFAGVLPQLTGASIGKSKRTQSALVVRIAGLIADSVRNGPKILVSNFFTRSPRKLIIGSLDSSAMQRGHQRYEIADEGGSEVYAR